MAEEYSVKGRYGEDLFSEPETFARNSQKVALNTYMYPF